MTDGKKGDCYSAGERGFMEWGQNFRARALGPLLAWLDKAGITPDVLTFISLIVGVIAALLLQDHTAWALFFLVWHVALDGLDGPLARHQKIESIRGSFTDTMADQAVITAVVLAAVQYGAVGAVAGGLYIFFYTLVVVFAMVRNHLNIPYTWLLRPRFLLYLWLPLEFYLWPGSLNFLIWALNALLLGLSLRGFYRIRKVI